MAGERRGEDALRVVLPAEQLYFEDVTLGLELPELVRGPIDISHMARWSSAVQEWHKIHYDAQSAHSGGFPGAVVNMSWWQHVVAKHLREWLGEGGWLWRFRVGISYATFPVAGDTISLWATVRESYEHDGLGVVEFEIGIRKQTGEECLTSGEATGILPLRDGPPVPYPFPGSFVPPRHQPPA